MPHLVLHRTLDHHFAAGDAVVDPRIHPVFETIDIEVGRNIVDYDLQILGLDNLAHRHTLIH